jgi:ribosome recycling factor
MTTNRKTLIGLVQEQIDKGATTVEEIHKRIADLPLKVLEDSDVLKKQAKEVQRVQDRTIGAIYDLIRDVNEKIGSFASDLLAEAAKRRPAPAAAAAKPHIAHRAAAH